MDAGNYEKDLEDSDAAAPGLEDNWNYNAVSSAIIDSALADPAVVDYTGACCVDHTRNKHIKLQLRRRGGLSFVGFVSTGVTLPDGTKEHGMYEDARLTAP